MLILLTNFVAIFMQVGSRIIHGRDPAIDDWEEDEEEEQDATFMMEIDFDDDDDEDDDDDFDEKE